MARGVYLNRIELHKYLFSLADRTGKLEIYQKTLAEKMKVTRPSMSLIMKDLTESGRIKKISSRSNNVGVYVIRDPSTFEHKFVPQKGRSRFPSRCQECGEFESFGKHPLPAI